MHLTEFEPGKKRSGVDVQNPFEATDHNNCIFTGYCQLKSPPNSSGLRIPRSSPSWSRFLFRMSSFMSVDRRLRLHFFQHHLNCCVPRFLRLRDFFPMAPFVLMLLDQAVGGSEDAGSSIQPSVHSSSSELVQFVMSRVPATIACEGSCSQGAGDQVGRMGLCASLFPTIGALVGESEPPHPPPSRVSSHPSWSAHPSSSQFQH